MNAMPIAKLDRQILKLSGENVTEWLSGLVTNTIENEINFAALLTPQGKIIADFFIVRNDDGWLIDTASKFADALKKRLSMYKLRAPIEITETKLAVHAIWDGTGDEGLADPRHAALGRRLYSESLDTTASAEDYDAHRLSLGIPDSQWDFDTSEIFPATANMDRLAGVDFKKGCFVGQEVVSRMYRKTEVKKRLRGFRYAGELASNDIKAGERTAGQILHSRNGIGMAMIRHDRLPDDGAALRVGEIEISLLDLPNGNTP